MRVTHLWPAVLVAAGLAACADPQAPAPGVPDPAAPAPAPTTVPEAAFRDGAGRGERLERQARRVARALRDPAFRAEVKRAIDASPFREGKVHFQRAMDANGRRGYTVLAQATGEDAMSLAADAEAAGVLEMYLPVAAHRAAWTGDERLLVATAERDGERPVAYDLRGRRHLLDPRTPPETPVLAIVPAEIDFTALPRLNATCDGEECGGVSGGSTGGTLALVTPGLYMSRVEFVDDFESWLKGSPEYEIHIMGPASTSPTADLVSFQCIGEHAPANYRWDLNSRQWTGSQLLYSSAQLDAFARSYPSRAFTIMAYEDDDAACQIRTDQNRAAEFFSAIGAAVAGWDGAWGQDIWSEKGITRLLKAARSSHNLLDAAYSFFVTADDLIGIAIEDKVSGRYRPNTNWTFLNDKVQANGWIQLEFK